MRIEMPEKRKKYDREFREPGSFTVPRSDRRVETRKCLPSRGNLDLRRFKISSLEGTP